MMTIRDSLTTMVCNCVLCRSRRIHWQITMRLATWRATQNISHCLNYSHCRVTLCMKKLRKKRNKRTISQYSPFHPTISTTTSTLIWWKTMASRPFNNNKMMSYKRTIKRMENKVYPKMESIIYLLALMTTQMVLRMQRDGLSNPSCSLVGIRTSLENFSKSQKKLAHEYCLIKSDDHVSNSYQKL